jgi:hypothetical protein
MAKNHCIISWVPDEGATGSMKFMPVTCETLLAALSMVIARQQLGMELDESEVDIVNNCIKIYEDSGLINASS